MLKMREVQAQLSRMGLTFRHDDGEYRVNYRGGDEGTAYYTNDLADALGTGLKMQEEAALPCCQQCGQVVTDDMVSTFAPFCSLTCQVNSTP